MSFSASFTYCVWPMFRIFLDARIVWRKVVWLHCFSEFQFSAVFRALPFHSIWSILALRAVASGNFKSPHRKPSHDNALILEFWFAFALVPCRSPRCFTFISSCLKTLLIKRPYKTTFVLHPIHDFSSHDFFRWFARFKNFTNDFLFCFV